MILLLKILLAHLIGDFFLQPESWVKHKEHKTLKSVWLYVHIAIHIALLFLILWDVSLIILILSIGVSHFIIDALKLSFQKKKTKRLWFFIDQALHILSIIALVYLFSDAFYFDAISITKNHLLLVFCLLILTKPTSIVMRTIFSKWDINALTQDNESLKDAGKYIGILERLLVFIFIISDHWEAVGFLITAKSVFRFGDLTASKERKLTEYILIGTLISFGIAIIIGIIYKTLYTYV